MSLGKLPNLFSASLEHHSPWTAVGKPNEIICVSGIILGT